MALNINGTTGISGVDGSASAPALKGTDSNTGVSFGSDFISFNTAGTERARFADSGNFGINRTTPTYPLVARRTDVSGIIAEFANSSGYGLQIGQNSETGEAYLRTGSGQPLAFVTNGGSGLANERMRIDSSGKVQIATTTSLAQLTVAATWPVAAISCDTTSSNASAAQIQFRFNNSAVGNIVSNSSNTFYNTSSDYRLKENIVGISDGITRLKTLKPSRFNFKVDKDTTVDGFLAHEVTAVPEAITGTKDEVATEDNDEIGVKKGDPIYQGIDQSKLVPLLTAALQEAVGKIEVLETKVAALEAA